MDVTIRLIQCCWRERSSANFLSTGVQALAMTFQWIFDFPPLNNGNKTIAFKVYLGHSKKCSNSQKLSYSCRSHSTLSRVHEWAFHFFWVKRVKDCFTPRLERVRDCFTHQPYDRLNCMPCQFNGCEHSTQQNVIGGGMSCYASLLWFIVCEHRYVLWHVEGA